MADRLLKKGIVYIVQNPAFLHLFKIGSTGMDTVEERGLNASNVPEDFEILFGYECSNPEEVEKLLHKTFEQFRHYSKTGRKTEFFYVGCLLKAKETLRLLKGVAKEISGEDIKLEENENAEYVKEKNIERITKKGPLFTFSKVNIKPGTTLVFTEDGNEECIVTDSKNDRTVLYKNKEYFLAPLVQKLKGDNASVRGIRFFKVKGDKETLEEKFDRIMQSH